MSHLPLFASSPIFPLTAQTPTTLLEHDEHLGPDERSHCDDLRHADGFTQTVTPTGFEPKIIETNVIDAEAINPEDLEPRRIDLGTDPYQIHERFVRSSLTGDMEEFRKVGADMSYFQSQTAAKIMDVIARLPGCDGQAADAISAYTNKNGGCFPDCSKFPNRNVQMFGYVFHDSNGQKHGTKLKILWYLLNETCTVIHKPDCYGRETSNKLY